MVENPDSALRLIHKTKQLVRSDSNKDLLKKSHYLQSSSYFYKGDYDSSVYFSRKLLSLAKETGDMKYLARALTDIAYVHYYENKTDSAIHYFIKSLELWELLEDEEMISATSNDLGLVYHDKKEYENALSYYLRSLRIEEEKQNRPGMAYALNNIGIIYHDWKNYDKALEYYLRAHEIEKMTGNKNGIASSLNNLAIIYSEKGNKEKAIEYLKESLRISKEIGDETGMSFAYHNLGEEYFTQGYHDMGIQYLKKSLKIETENNNIRGIAEHYSSVGEMYYRAGKYAESRQNIEKSLEYASQLELPSLKISNYKYLHKAEAELGNFEQAYKHYHTYDSLYDTIYNSQIFKQMAEVQTKYETEKKEKELALKNARLKASEMRLEQNKRTNLIFLLLAVMLLILLIVIFHLYYLKKKVNRQLIKQNTDLINTTEKLKESESKSRVLLNAPTDSVMLIDKDGIILEANISMAERLNKSVDDLTGTMLWDHFEKEVRGKRKHYFLEALRSGKVVQFEDSRDGTWYENVMYPIIDQSGEVEKVGIFAKDITSNKRYQLELKAAKEKAEQSDRLKTNFLCNMSHEIRTPMNAIVGFASLLNHEALSEKEREEYLKLINANSKNLLNLINDIMDISKIEAGGIDIRIQPFDVNKLLDELKITYEGEITNQEKKDLDLIVEKCEEESFCINSSEERIRQILHNLLNNAVKFTSSGQVRFGVEAIEKNSVRFFVQDTGIGIPDEKRSQVFERFRQLDEGNTRKYGGTGIGLTICKKLTEMLGGRITLESEPGKGSRFSFSVYDHPQTGNDNDNDGDLAGTSNYLWENKKILVAEDVECNYSLIEKILKNTGARILWAHSGQEAVDMVKTENPDLVLMDIRMPGLSGIEATKKIRQINPSIPVIAQTAYAMAEEKTKIDETCDDYVAKPIIQQVLLDKIQYWLTRQRQYA